MILDDSLIFNYIFKVVITPATHVYLDHPEEPDHRERGFYWATRYTDMKQILSFQPFDIYANSAYALNWSPLGAVTIYYSERIRNG